MERSLDVQLVDLSNMPSLFFALLNSLFVAAMFNGSLDAGQVSFTIQSGGFPGLFGTSCKHAVAG